MRWHKLLPTTRPRCQRCHTPPWLTPHHHTPYQYDPTTNTHHTTTALCQPCFTHLNPIDRLHYYYLATHHHTTMTTTAWLNLCTAVLSGH